MPEPGAAAAPAVQEVAGPAFDDLAVGQTFHEAPAVTLTDGLAAVHQAIAGDRLPLPLDAELSRRVCGTERPLAHPQLVTDVAIGQSTVATQRVVANLFYRRLALRRAPALGDTLSTVTTVAGLRRNRERPGREPTGLVLLRIVTADQHGRTVLDFWRCAMLPAAHGAGERDRAVAGSLGEEDRPSLSAADLAAAVRGWDPAPLRARRERGGRALPAAGGRWRVVSGDTVSCAPELARLTLNVAAVHHDPAASPQSGRLVYGGHVVGLAAGQLARALPELAYIVGWHGCDHLAPVREGDVLRSEIELERVARTRAGIALLHLRVRSFVGARPVLDWRCVGVAA